MPVDVTARLLDTATHLLTSNNALNPAEASNFTNLIFSSFSGLSESNSISINDTLYFSADDGQYGKELWKSDGTVTGTVLVKDINPGVAGADPAYLTRVNDLLYFSVNDEANGMELWKSDGTAAGTVLVKDINVGTASAQPAHLTNLDGTLYFSANDGIHGTELWKSDGTAAGTVLVKDVNLGTANAQPAHLTNLDGTLYFGANDGIYGAELWKSDGTVAGTVLVKDINPGISNSFPTNLLSLNNTLYFSANSAANGVELWKSDGTVDGTVLVKDINPGVSSAYPTGLTSIDDTLYFSGDDGARGRELWKSDGTAAGTILVKDINPGVSSAYPTHLSSIDDMLYFTNFDHINGSTLWKTDGSAAGTALVRAIDSRANASNTQRLINVDGTLYFTHDKGVNGVELWTSDGTPNGTALLGSRDASSENIVFPSDAGILNVKNFGAKGDGVTDDTAAIQVALNAYPNGQRIIYLPNGTYVVSGTLTWPAGTPGTGNDYKNTILQGQSEQGAIIKLKDGASGFTNISIPKAVIFTGPAPAQRFGNSIRNLTVDTGTGNTGAIGIQFNASNRGSMRQVTIQSGDGQGVNGLDMNFTDEIGPLLVKGVTVKGFQYGIRTGYTVNSQTLENITLQNQSVYGLYNTGQVINIRGLTSTNSVTAIYNAGGHMTLLDSTFNGADGTPTGSAIRSDATLLARNIKTSGYQAAIQSGNNTLVGPTVSEFVSSPAISQFPSPTQTLNLPIRETPDVPWDHPSTMLWANVVAYGAIPNDGLDDTAAIQAAIDSGSTTVYLPVGTYNLQGTVFIRNNARRIIGTEATVDVPNTISPGFKVVDGTNPTVVFERINSGYNSTPTLENASSRTLVIRDATNVSGNMTGTGDVFIENVVSNPFSSWTFNQQNIWARQFNVENSGTHITNNGGNLWIFGLKTERGGTLIDTKGGGKTELLGGLAYTTTAGPDGTQNYPMFINNESSVSISLSEVNFGAPNYSTYVRETRGGVTRNLLGSSLTNYVGGGENIPLYVGYQ